MRHVWRSSLLLAALTFAVSLAESNDEITDLPGLNFNPNFKHYSGYFKVSDTHYLHYWFVESQGNVDKDPLMFWFNGGPGCSSIVKSLDTDENTVVSELKDGLLKEMGPYRVAEDGRTLVSNPNAWNQFASIVYIEAPAGVGYSYTTDNDYSFNDEQTATENYAAVKEFFKRFPQFRRQRTFIAGESYGGVYIPTLVAKIIDGQDDFKINLKGMLIGNGYVNEVLNVNTMLEFAYAHGLIDERQWNELVKQCCGGCTEGCDFLEKCEMKAFNEFSDLWRLLNPYDLYRDCDSSGPKNSVKRTALGRGITPKLLHTQLFARNATTSPRRQKIEPSNRSGAIPCLNDTDITTYMNNADVRRALHIPDDLGEWSICNDEVSWSYNRNTDDVTPYVLKAHDAKVRTLLYYGDTDMACNFLLGQRFAENLGLEEKSSKTAWIFNGQVAGFKTVYAGRLIYLTVRGSGHMAPQWRAPQTQHAVRQFLANHRI